ncbi:MAG: hypothetical protein PHP92_04260, partial [Candidatus Nanoarchaeia archaeon]|nr:hypothetical protein [Candidatus Nanoarchaeia archaeon]
MEKKIISTQKEFDELIQNKFDGLIIIQDSKEKISVRDIHVVLKNSSAVMRENSSAEMWGNSSAVMRENSSAVMREN